VWWKGNLWFAATACFRAPKAMSWNDFLANVVYPLWSCDPDFDAETTKLSWAVDETPIAPSGEESLESLGVGHKSLISCQAA